MHLSKIIVENFRGIKHAEILFERDITVLVGENNTGKTSILEALRLCLDTVKSDKTCNFSEFDFYRNEARGNVALCDPIRITLNFFETEDNPWPDHITQGLNDVIVGSDFSAIKLQVIAKYDVEAGEPTQRWAFLDDADNELLGKAAMIKELRRFRPFFFQTALRAAKDQFHGQSTYWASFLKNKDIDDATRRSLEQELLQVNQKIVDAHLSFRDVVYEVKRISELVDVGQADVVSVDPVPPDVYKSLRYTDVNILSATNAKIPIRSHGEGTQSLSILLLFSAYLKTRLQADVDLHAEPIIAIEEPEAHLHPNAIRAVWRLLLDLPGQKIIATHSGDILSEVPVPKLRRMRRKDEVTECNAIPAELLSNEELRKFNHHVRRNRGELLFARIWLIVEGETDVSVFAECADIIGVDLHAKGVRIVECSQAGGPGIFIKAADALGIHWYLVADGDERGQEYIDIAKTLLNGRSEANHISAISYSNIDVLLCHSGFGQPYRDGVGRIKEAELDGLTIDSVAYWEKVYKLVKNSRRFSKPEAALKSILAMKTAGADTVPTELKRILNRITAKGEEGT